MEKKLLVKRIVYIAICIVLAVVSCIMLCDLNAINAGEGNGTNAKIQSMQQMGEMLEAFSPQLTDYNFSGSNIEIGDIGDGDSEINVGKYKSVTFSEDSSAYVKLDYSRGSDGSGFSIATYQRYMQVYITESATFYHSECTVTTDAETSTMKEGKAEVSKNYSDISLNMDILIAKDRVMLRINKVHMAVNGVNNYTFERVLGRWGDFTDDVAEGRSIISEFNSVNKMNFRILSAMGNCISGYNSDRFSKKGSSYSLKSDPFKSFATTLLSIVGSPEYLSSKELSGKFEVDLGDDTNPIVYLTIENEYELDKVTAKETGVTLSFDYFEYDEFNFSAINNTVIKGYDDISALSAEEYTKLLVEAA